MYWLLLLWAHMPTCGAWFAGHSARFRMRPATALMSGQRLGGCSNLTRTGSQADSILSHLGLAVVAGQVAKSTHGRLSDVLAVTGLQDGADQSFDAIRQTHNCLVVLIVAG